MGWPFLTIRPISIKCVYYRMNVQQEIETKHQKTVSRRKFLGWGAGLAAAAAIPNMVMWRRAIATSEGPEETIKAEPAGPPNPISRAAETLKAKYIGLAEAVDLEGVLTVVTMPGWPEAQVTAAGDLMIEKLGIEAVQSAGRSLEAERALGANRVLVINDSAIYNVDVDWQKAAEHDREGILRGQRVVNLFNDHMREDVFGAFTPALGGGVMAIVLNSPAMKSIPTIEERNLATSKAWVHEEYHYGQRQRGEAWWEHPPELREAENAVEEPFIFLSRK